VDSPKAFISYSWDDDPHMSWVRQLATRLCKDGVEVTLDQWHVAPGDQLPASMAKAVSENDFVLIICTPKYKLKADGDDGGAAYEGDIIQGEVFVKGNHRKFVPVLRRGTWETAAPSTQLGKSYIDLRDGKNYECNYRDLLLALHRPRPEPPAVDKDLSKRVPLKRRVLKSTWGLGLATVIIAFLAWLIYPLSDYEKAFRQNPLNAYPLTSGSKVTMAAISPNGKYLAYARYAEAETADSDRSSLVSHQELHIKQVSAHWTEPGQILVRSAAVTYRQILFSPDGEYIYYGQGSNEGGPAALYKIGALGGESTLVQRQVADHITLSPDGTRYAFVRRREGGGDPTFSIVIRQLDALSDNGRTVQIFAERKSPSRYYAQTAAWSPNGRLIALLAGQAGSPKSDLVVVDTANGKEQPLKTGDEWNTQSSLVWLSDGSGIITETLDPAFPNQLSLVAYPSGRSRQLIDNKSQKYDVLNLSNHSKHFVVLAKDVKCELQVLAPLKSAKEVFYDPMPVEFRKGESAGMAGLTWTPDNRLVYTALDGRTSKIRIVDSDGHNAASLVGELGRGEDNYFSPAVSANGKIVVFVSNSSFLNEQAGLHGSNIWKMDIQTRELSWLTSGGSDYNPRVFGNWVVYASGPGKETTIWRIALDKKEPPEQMTPERDVYDPAISPNGQLLAVRAYVAGKRAVKIIPLAFREMVRDPNRETEIVFVLHNFDLSPWGSRLQWKDDRTLSYVEHINGIGNIWSYSLSTQRAEPLTHFTSGQIQFFAWSQDGRLAVSRGEVTTNVMLISDEGEGGSRQ